MTRTKAAEGVDERIRGMRFALGVFAVTRLVVAIEIFVISRFASVSKDHAYSTWDQAYFDILIRLGYPHHAQPGIFREDQNVIGFFPLFPLAARVLHTVIGLTPLEAGLIVSLVAGATAVVLLWLLAAAISDARIANNAVVIFCLFPGSITLSLLMSENVFLLFAIGSLLALYKQRWLLAGGLAAFATASRPTAVVLVACCAWAAAVAIKQRREWRALIAPALAPLGIICYFVFLQHLTGEFFAWFHVERTLWKYDNWGLFHPLYASFVHPFANLNNLTALIALACAALGTICLWRMKAPVTLLIFVLGLCGLAYASGGTASKVRYVWTAFPLAIAISHWANTRFRFLALATLEGTASLFYIVATIFTQQIVL